MIIMEELKSLVKELNQEIKKTEKIITVGLVIIIILNILPLLHI
jgi:hypothetical protein